MADAQRAVNGDFHVIRMDGLFHVVFRPDSDPEWFRIIATFYTYERAYSYCDVERVTVWTWTTEKGETFNDSITGDEEAGGLRSAPVHLDMPASEQELRDGVPELVRGIYDGGEHVLPHPIEDFSEHPNEDERPEDFHARLVDQAVAKLPADEPKPAEPEKPTCIDCGGPRSPSSALRCRKCYQIKALPSETERLTDNQKAVLKWFRDNQNWNGLVTAPYREIADGSGVLKTSAGGLVDILVRKGFIEVVTKGGPGQSSTFRIMEQTDATRKAEA